MNNKQKRKFKIIPFCISLLMVILVTGGIGVYTTFYYGETDKAFLNKYLDENVEENKNLPINQFLDKVLKLEYSYVSNADSQQDLGLSYRDPNTKKTYTEEKFGSYEDGNVNNYYKNNIMHVNSYFDVELKLVVSETTNEKGETVTSLQYMFYFYNMDYTKMGIESANEAQERIRIGFVEGVNSKPLADYTDDEEKEGDAALEEMLTKLEDESDYTGAPSVMKYNYGYTNAKKGVDVTANLRDKNAKINPEKMEKSEALVQKLNLSVGVNPNNEYFDEMESATFSIILLNDDGEEGFTNLVEGTVSNILSIDEMQKRDTDKGYNNVLYKSPLFVKYTWTKIALASGIAFVLSGVLATLFYMIWIDEKAPTQKGKKQK